MNKLLFIAVVMLTSVACEKTDGHLNYGNALPGGDITSNPPVPPDSTPPVVSGVAFAFGTNSVGQLGFAAPAMVAIPTALNDGHDWLQLSSLNEHTCGIDDQNDAYCWGSGYKGMLGNNSEDDKNTPTIVSGGLKWKSISAGYYHSCGITVDDEAYCWGWNRRGAIGDNTTVDRWVPTLVLGGHTWKSISAGYDTSCGVNTSGVAYCWGDGGVAVTGNSDLGLQLQLGVPVAGGLTWESISIGPEHACGLTTDSLAYCWGYGGLGQLGDGVDYSWEEAPVPVLGGHTFKSLVSGLYHVCGITLTDAAYCWGYSEYGQLGDNIDYASTFIYNNATPVLVVGGHSWKKIDPGYQQTCGITTSGDAYCWGRQTSGQLGNNVSIGFEMSPNIVSGDHTWLDIVAGLGFAVGLQ